MSVLDLLLILGLCSFILSISHTVLTFYSCRYFLVGPLSKFFHRIFAMYIFMDRIDVPFTQVVKKGRRGAKGKGNDKTIKSQPTNPTDSDVEVDDSNSP